MTRRIAIAILITVWAILLTGGAATYVVTRSILLADLDDTLMARALSLPEVERPANLPRTATVDARDRFLVKNDRGQTVARPTSTSPFEGSGGGAVPMPKLVSAEFARIAGGTRVRTITVQAFARREDSSLALTPVTIVYSGPADRFDELLRNLLITFGIVGLLGGALTAGIAVRVARAALKPMLRSSDLLAAVNENSLNQRVDTASLPAELAPVGLKINEMLERLEASFAQRKRFMADASHELRTPVAALVTTLEVTLRRGRSEEEYARAMNTCLFDAQLLKTLVEALMEQVRAEQYGGGGALRGGVMEEMGPVNVSHLAKQCVELVGSLAEEKGVAMERTWEDSMVMITSESRVRAILLNLLGNAVEYTGEGGKVWLEMKAVSRTAEGLVEQLRMEVRDTGVGIGSEDLAHLFEAFYRADKVRGHEKAHLGLGLYLVKTHVEALQGRIEVESEVGRGSVFRAEIVAGILGGVATGRDAGASENSVMRGREMMEKT